MNILKLNTTLKNLNGPVFLLIRHAERHVIPSGETDHLIKITVQGRKSAEELGRMIGNRLSSVTTSSVPRCLDTSDAIIKGSGNSTMPIDLNWRLGNPGIWITDGEAASYEFHNHKINQIIRRQVVGENLKGFRPLEEGIDIMLDFILGINLENDGINVLVSHDAVIAPFIGYLLEISEPEDIIPDFLEGIILSRTESGIKAFWRDRWFNISKGVR